MKKNYLLMGRLVLILACLLSSSALFSQTTETFSPTGSNQTFNVPAGVTQVSVQAWGGGGRGGSRTSGSSGYGGGGGGAYSSGNVNVDALNSYQLFVGAGSSSNNADGGDSWFGSNTTIMAKGGETAGNNVTTGQAGGAAASGYGTVKNSGGPGRNAGSGYGGGGGSGAGPSGNGLQGTGTNLGGLGAVPGGGNGGNGRSGSSGDGSDGIAPGGGGGGAYRTSGSPVGGDGGAGRVTVTYICPTYSLTATTSTAPTVCTGSGMTVTLTGGSGLPTGNYTVTYNLTGTNTGAGLTATMTVTAVGTGTFTTATLANTGSTTVTITRLASGGCSTNIAANNTVTRTLATVPGQPSAITGNATPCAGTTQNYSVTNVAGVTYNWTLPSGWAITAGSGTNAITVTAGSTSGTISVTASNACGAGTARTLSVTPSAAPAQPSAISGSATPCTGTSVNYSVTNVSGTTYTWTLPAGWTKTAGGTTSSITVTIGTGSGSISVTPSNACGNGTASTLAVSALTTPAQPSIITGFTAVCSGFSNTYSVTDVPGTTYNWTFPSGWTVTAGAGTATVTVTANTTSGTVSVTPANGCGNGTARTLSVTVTTSPTITSTTPGSRVGFGTVNIGANASAGVVNWYAAASGGPILHTGNTFTTPDLVTSTTFYAEAFNGSCPSAVRTSVLATVNLPEIALSGNGTNIADEDATPETTDYTNLGTTGVGTPLTRTYTIQNTGTVTLTIGAITIGGTNAAEFVVQTNPASSVPAGGSTTFSIRFTPTVLGTRNATISFATNDYDENPFNFAIMGIGGTGLYPEMNITGNGTTIIDGDSGPTTTDHSDFGTVTIPGSVTRTFTIQNTGAGTLNLTGSPRVVLTGDANFTMGTQPAASVAPGGSTTFTVTFTPSTTGVSVAIVSINNDDSDESVYDFVIQGTALTSGKEIDIQGNEVSIADGDTTPSQTDHTDFGLTDPSTPISIPFNVYSFGSSSLNITAAVGISGTNASMFSATALPTSLSSGAVTTFVVTFTPTASVGVKTATITVTNGDSDEGVYTFDLRAEVQAAPTLATAPGGITGNLRLWLKANSNVGSLSDGDLMSSWGDQTTGSTKTAIAKFSQEPRFRNNAAANVNFNPVVAFDGGDAMYGGQGFYNHDMYIVVKPTNTINYASNPQDIYCGDDVAVNKNSQDVTGFQMGNTSSRHANETLAYNQGANTSYGIAELSTTKTYTGVNIFNPRKNTSTNRMELLCNGSLLSTSEVFTATYKDISNSRYWLGRSEFFDASYNGQILEIVNYSARNNDTSRRQIETYLALKYGITLGVNGTSLDYVDSFGNNVYPASAGFNYNIAGIGRDDKSGLDQRQSKTENTYSDITMGLGSIYNRNSDNVNAFENDRDFLVWGHNNATLTAQSPIVVNMSSGIPGLTSQVDFISIGRIWKVIESGSDVKTVTVSIPEEMLTSTITPPGAFLMFISSSPIFNPTAEYRVMRANGSNLETTFDFNGTKYITFGYAPERTFVRSIDFDGVDDYLDAGDVLDLDGAFSISAWVKRTNANASVVSKRNSGFSEGYDFRINASGQAEMRWMNGTLQSITSSVVIPTAKWHNIAVTYDGTDARLYIDGVLDVTKALTSVPPTGQSFLIAAADGTVPGAFFDGTIDEVRVWGSALSADELRFIMNQEIVAHANGSVSGSTVPATITKNETGDVLWGNLRAYYPMSTYTYTNAKDMSENNFTASLRNLTTVDHQTAPVPYVTDADGPWYTAATWKNNTVQDLPYALSIIDGATRIGWNIVDIDHNVTSTGNKVVLSADLAATKKLSVESNTRFEVSHYLKLDGTIDLTGRSQLLQTAGSDLAVNSAGRIERDQQGQTNLYNYNYWCSPVGNASTISNNTGYSINSVMRDGTDEANPVAITWVDDYDATPGTPIKLASYWLYKFQNLTNEYANWQYLGPNGALGAGEGFTMKGSANGGSEQNYVFIGKPNNGQITLPVAAGNLNLCGNPYASALDGNDFIADNLGSIDGTLYFWEHFPTNDTHNLADYQGGYAALTMVGGTPPVSPDEVSGEGSSSRIPGRYIPVGQGFFVTGSASGGTITFNNNQRDFAREDQAVSNPMFRTANDPSGENGLDDHSVALPEETPHPKVRLGFVTPNGYHRQVLLGFMGEQATSGIDAGYDALLFDEFPHDMYLVNGGSKLVISGEGTFETAASYPVGVKVSQDGNIAFRIDDTEHFAPGQQFYIHDASDDSYHNITDGDFTIALTAGTYDDRFSLRFNGGALGTDSPETGKDVAIRFEMNTNTLVIDATAVPSVQLESATLFNIAGQSIHTWDIEKSGQELTRIAIKNTASGTYIVKLLTSMGPVSKKIVIR